MPHEIAVRIFDKHAAEFPLDTGYTGILSLQALAHLASDETPEVGERCRQYLLPFVKGEVKFPCNFKNYLCGGNASAIMLWNGGLPEAEGCVRRSAEDLIRCAPRDASGIFSCPLLPEQERIWIDVAFAVTPFLLYAGLALKEAGYVDEAVDQTLKMYEVLLDKDCGLLHQCKNFSASGRTSEDHWSRGNGWGMLAFAELVDVLPREHPRSKEVRRLFRDFVHACLKVQDEKGMWRQEMTMPNSFESYPETSGTGLILYGIGVGLATGVLSAEYRKSFEKGLEGYRAYIEKDGSIHNTCPSCRNPGSGSIQGYLDKKPVTNDPHAFGPAILAFGVAHRLGIGIPKSH